MQKVRYLDALCLFNCFLFSVICISLGVSQDSLLFKSDLVNLCHFIFGVHVLMLIPLLVLFVPFFVLVRKLQENIIALMSLLITANLLFGFGICVIDKYFSGIQPVRLFFILACVMYIGSLALVIPLFRRGKNKIQSRVIKFSKALMLFVIISFLSLTLFRHAQKRLFYSKKEGKNVVMIVMDGVNTKALPVYNKDADIGVFEEIAEESMLYMNAYTNFPNTYDYCNALYSGRKDGNSKKKNLLSVLQQAGVNARWLTYHENGIPETSHIESYNGLRSLYLHHRLSWIPYWLGIDYNTQYLFVTAPRASQAMSPRQTVLRKILNRLCGGKIRKPLETYLAGEIKKLRGENRLFFLVFLVNPRMFAGTQNKNGPRDLWKNLNVKSQRDEIEKRIKSNQYVYEEKDSWLIREWKNIYEDKLKSAMESLKNFYDFYKRNGWDEDTILIVTADHGQIFSKGKIWYVYHNDEEVVRVPLLIYNGKGRGIDNRLRETIDITQTMMEIFNIKERFSDKAVSLIGDDNEKIVTSLTRTSSVRGERFLNIYKYEKGHLFRYVFDLEKTGYATKELVNGYDTIEVDQGGAVFDDIGRELQSVLNDYGIR